MNSERILDISWSTILKISIAVFCFYLLYLIRDILIWFVFALIISILFNPAIDSFRKKRLPRFLATTLVYVAIFGISGLVIYWVAPLFIQEIRQFTQIFPQYFEKISPLLKELGIEAFESLEILSRNAEDWLVQASTNIFGAIVSIFGGVIAAISIFSIALFLSLEEKGIERMLVILSPKKYEAVVLNIWEKSQRKVAGWFGARILCCLFVGLATFFACYVLDIKYAASLGFLAALLNIIPIVGPAITGIIILIFTALTSWLKAIFILIAFILIQQIEGNILTPALTKKFIGLPPVLVIVALLVGGKLWGILGAILAIPIAGILFEFLRDFLKRKKESQVIVL